MATKRRASPKQRADAAEQRKDELDDLHGRLAEHVEQLTQDSGWREWLDVAARFHSYSFNNTLLIFAQKPSATLVAGYRDWQKMGRQVRKGEGGPNAIRILAPVKRRVPVGPEDDARDGDRGTERTDQDGTVTRVATVGFKPTSVFDVTQTDGEPLPEQPRPQLLAGAAPEGLWEALETFGTQRGWHVARERINDGSNGYTDFSARTIRVRDDVEPAQAVKTLAHEIGHALLHDDGSARVATHRGIAEVEAESVAHLVLAAHGANTDAYTFDYITGWATQVPGQEPADTVRATAQRVLRASRTVLDDTLDARLDTAALRQQRDRAASAAQETSALADRAQLRAGVATGERPRGAETRAAQSAGRASRAQWVTNEPELFTAPDRIRRLASANEAAAAFYREQLDHEATAHGYVEARIGSLSALPEGVRVGYAPAGWTALLDHLREAGFDDRDLLDAGLVQHTRRDTLIDRFRDRVVVAVHDDEGTVAGFIGRPPHEDFDPQRVPKYLNTSATDLFDKGRLLFGVHEQRDALGQGAVPVMVEGPFDALALSAADGQAGRVAPFATLGTAVTPQHLLTVHDAASSRRLVLGLDGDAAGQAAVARAADMALDLPRTATVVALPDGHDPASWVAAHREDPQAALHPYLDHEAQTPAATLVIEHRIEAYFADHPPQHREEVEGRIEALRAAAPVLARLDGDAATEQGLRTSQTLGLDAATVAGAIGRARADDGEATKRVHDRAVTAPRPHTDQTTAPALRRASREPARPVSATRPHPARR